MAILEQFHNKGFIHRDIKPDNFVTGPETYSDKIYIIDYGLCKRYFDCPTGRHIPFRNDRKLTGTARYASINNHLGCEQSRRDDLESLSYTLIYFMKGRLPWQGVQPNQKRGRNEQILHSKQSFDIDFLCRGLPDEMAIFMLYCRSLSFEDKPDYVSLRKQFTDYLAAEKLDINFHYDWVPAQSLFGMHRSTTVNLDLERKGTYHGNQVKQGVVVKQRTGMKVSNSFLDSNFFERKNSVVPNNSKLLLVPTESYISVINGSNYAEIDPYENSSFKNSGSSCNLKEDDIDEENAIPNERPINTYIKVPVFNCTKKPKRSRPIKTGRNSLMGTRDPYNSILRSKSAFAGKRVKGNLHQRTKKFQPKLNQK